MKAMFCFHIVLVTAHIKHILVCADVSISPAPGDHLSDCIRFASWKECKALFAQGNNPIQSQWGQQLWRQKWNNNFFLKANRFFFFKLISICVLSILSYDRPLLGAVSTLCHRRRHCSTVWRIMNPCSSSFQLLSYNLGTRHRRWLVSERRQQTFDRWSRS